MCAVGVRRQAVLTMYQIPKMMVPVRTWQHRQQLVEYQRSHGEIIILSVSPQLRGHLKTRSPNEGVRGRPVHVHRASALSNWRNVKHDPGASDLSATYHRQQINAADSVRFMRLPVSN